MMYREGNFAWDKSELPVSVVPRKNGKVDFHDYLPLVV